ncbi:MAG: metal ABC transporter solute-binding protein, Zn/Mn family [Roseovarius sp.]
MSRNLLTFSAAAALLAGTALADAPRVATDIAPVHSLVARVMEGVGEPALVLAPGASPHEYSLRPSEAGALQEADVVFWIGPELTPWLEDALGTLAGDARSVGLMKAEGTMALSFREGALFEAHDHGHEEADHSGHGDAGEHDHEGEEHANHEGHDHEGEEHANHEGHEHEGDHDGHDEHGHGDHAEEAADHGHAHEDHDPHMWLSPDNASTWLDIFATVLSDVDPDNAEAYRANAEAGREEIAALKAEIDGILDPVRGGNFIVFHDAYQYFEAAFDIPASGAISLSDASDPSPARIAEIQSRVRDEGVTCVLAEPQFDPGIVETVMEGTNVKTGVLDPLGSDLEPGPDLYRGLLRNLATALAGCL